MVFARRYYRICYKIPYNAERRWPARISRTLYFSSSPLYMPHIMLFQRTQYYFFLLLLVSLPLSTAILASPMESTSIFYLIVANLIAYRPKILKKSCIVSSNVGLFFSWAGLSSPNSLVRSYWLSLLCIRTPAVTTLMMSSPVSCE